MKGQDKDRAKASRGARHSKNKNEEAQTLSGPPLPPQREPETEKQKKVAGKESTTPQPGDSLNGPFERALAERKEADSVPVVSRAPKPPTPTRSPSGIPPKPKPLQMPIHLPADYPKELIRLTRKIIYEAMEEFPVRRQFTRQTQITKVCKRVVSKLTPRLCAAVADEALSVMDKLLYCFLVANCDSSMERDRLMQETRESDEWSKLVGEIAGVPSAAVNDSSDIHLEGETPNRERLQDGDEASPANPLREPKQRGRPPTARRAIYEEAAAYKDAHNEISWGQLAKKYFPNEYRDDSKRCSDRVRMGVKRLKQAKRS